MEQRQFYLAYDDDGDDDDDDEEEEEEIYLNMDKMKRKNNFVALRSMKSLHSYVDVFPLFNKISFP